ncbi:hypothetical protein [Ochrobactrum sp. RH2CCR150]|uniref:hypothetical protein n=1 Tax=Ochrobactrum sp. RH2CCR150 TaxID=2587044 RepID=UPI0015F8A381|nr:hypothetical protein [Ochrobactrum sp. RH2CCR150]
MWPVYEWETRADCPSILQAPFSPGISKQNETTIASGCLIKVRSEIATFGSSSNNYQLLRETVTKGNVMIVKAGAARRECADTATIYNEALKESHTETTADGGLQISFVACAIHGRDRGSSQYRYTVILTMSELAILTAQYKIG